MNPHLLVSIRLRPTSAGGRQGAIPAGPYRGVVCVRDLNFSMRWSLADGLRLEPGGSAVTVSLEFLIPEIALPHFTAGTDFELWEGRVIGEGTVLRVTKGTNEAI